MTVYAERNNKTILSTAVDADGDELTVTKINGQASLVGVPIPLSVGGTVMVTPDGVVTFDDTGFDVPEIGDYVADGLIATISDGTDETDTSVNLELYGAVAGVPVYFGALTRPFEGGVPAPVGATSITSGDPAQHFVVSDGMLLPTLAGSGALSGSYTLTFDTGEAQVVVALPDTFSVAKDSEVTGLLNDDTQPYDGKVVVFRAGVYSKFTIPPQTLVSGFTLRGEEGAVIDNMQIRQLSGDPVITIRDLTFQAPEPETSFNSRLFVYDSDTPNGTFILENCHFKGHPGVVPNSDIWAAKIDYSGATGGFTVGETLTGENGGEISLPILEVHDNGDGSGTLFVSDNPAFGNGGSVKGNRVADGVLLTGDASGVVATATGPVYGGDGGMGNGLLIRGPAFREVYVRNNILWGLGEALRVAAPEIIEVTDNVCDECFYDFLKVILDGDNRPAQRLHVKRNLHMRPIGRAEDYKNPHVDGIQFLFGHMNQDLTGLEIVDNIFMLGGRAEDVAPIFLTQGSGNGSIENGIIDNNIFINGKGVCLRASRWRGGSVQANTAPYLTGDVHPPQQFLMGEVYADANTVYRGNIIEQFGYYTADGKAGGVSFNPPNNHTPGRDPDLSLTYDNVTGQTPVDITDLFEQLTPKANSPLMTGTSWVAGVDMGCVNEAGRYIGRDGSDLTDHMLALEARALGEESTNSLVQVGAIIVDDFAIDAWPYDVRAVFGENTAKIPVSGTIAPALEGISIRARQAGTNTPGQIIGTTQVDGTFSGSMAALEDGQNHQLEVFVDGQSSVSATTSNTYSTGNHIVMWTQSEYDNTFHPSLAAGAPVPATLSDPDNLWYVDIDNSTATVTSAPNPTILKTTDNAARGPQKFMSNVYANMAPGKKFVVIDCMIAGTSMFDLMDDETLTNRHWSVVKSMFDYLRDVIKDTPSFNFYSWYAGDRARYNSLGSPADSYGETANPYFFQETRTGTALALGDAHPLSSDSIIEDVDHSFFQATAPLGERGTGLYAKGEATFMFAVNGFLTGAPLGHFQDNLSDTIELLSKNLDWWLANDARAQEYGFTRGYDMNMWKLGNDFGSGYGDIAHPNYASRYGAVLVLEMAAMNHLKALGIVSLAEPVISDALWSDTDITLSVSVGIGNRLTTYRNEAALAPVAAAAHRGDVAGFQFVRGNTYDHPSGSDVSITDDGATTGTATLVIARDNLAGDRLEFMTGGGSGCLTTEDMEVDYNLNYPGVALAGVNAPLIPIKRHPEDGFLTASLQEPGVSFVALNTTRYQHDAGLVGSGLTVDMRLKLPEQNGSYLISYYSNVEVQQLIGGRLRMFVYSPGTFTSIGSGISANGSLPLDQDINVRVVVDYDLGTARALVDDVVILDLTLSETGNTISNAAPAALHVMGRWANSNHAIGEVSFVRAYDSANVDNSLPATVDAEIIAPAANANAPVGWTKNGGDVTDV